MPDSFRSDITLRINGVERLMVVDNRATLLDTLRERLNLTGSKKGCDHGQCGACTVLVNGDRTNSCLRLAVAVDGDEVVTIEGVADLENGSPDELHTLQRAFLDNDALQCGYCTPGQIMSALGAMAEADRGWPSHVTADTAAGLPGAHALDGPEVRERLSGNLCRCGAYDGICSAVLSLARQNTTASTGVSS